MGLSRTVSEINGDFRRKSQKFSHPRVFCAPAEGGFPLELDTSARDQKLEWWGYRAGEEVWRYLQPFGYNPPTCLTDGRTDWHRATAKTALTRIASRGKNELALHRAEVWMIRWMCGVKLWDKLSCVVLRQRLGIEYRQVKLD